MRTLKKTCEAAVNLEKTARTSSFAEVVAKLNHVLAAREQSFPVRDETYQQVFSVVEDLFELLFDPVSFERRGPEPGITEQFLTFAGRPIFICGSMKSGTTLLSQLLDDHPELVVIPGDSHYVRNAPKWQGAEFRTVALHWLQRMINPTGQPPYWFLGTERETLNRFLEHFHALMRQPGLEVFQAIVGAVYAASPRKVGKVQWWVEKTPHNELHAQALSRKYPQARFIHVIRNPLPNLASLKRIGQLCGWKRTLLEHGVMLRHLMRFGRSNQRTLGSKNYHMIKYEDLVSDSKVVMEGVCRFLGISFDEILLRPTSNGLPATSNTMYRESVVIGRILDQSKERRFVKELSPRELSEAVNVLGKEAMRFGYDLRAETKGMIPERSWAAQARDSFRAWFIGNRLRLDMALDERRRIKELIRLARSRDNATGSGTPGICASDGDRQP